MHGEGPKPQKPRPAAGAAGWPWWYALLAFFGGFAVSQLVILFVYLFWSAGGGSPEDDSGFTVLASALNEFVFVASAYVVARISGSASMRDFGLRRAPFWQTVGKMAVILVSYYVLLATVSTLLDLDPDDVPDELGAGSGAIGMLFFAILVALIAPIAEEFFFRGLVFRSLANGIGVWGGAIVSGVMFGAMHLSSVDGDRLIQVGLLTVFGILLALLYAWSGTLYACIAIHATNNCAAVAGFADKNDSDFGLALAGIFWLLMMVFCATGWLLTDRTGEPDPPPPPGGQGPLVAPERPIIIQGR